MCYNPPMHSVLLQAALTLYSVGLLHAILTVVRKRPVFQTTALLSMAAGLALHVASIFVRAAELEYIPLTQRADAFSFCAALTVLGFFVAYARYRIEPMGVFIFPLVFVATFIVVLSEAPSNAVPEVLRSNWIYVHTPFVFLGYAALSIAFAAALMYVIQERELKAKSRRTSISRLPSLETCDELAYKSLAIGFPLITLGILSGALWAQSVWGSIWGRDLKVILSLLTWLIYLLLIHYRLIAGWRGRKAAYLSIFGYIGLVLTFVGASYFGGLHSFVK